MTNYYRINSLVIVSLLVLISVLLMQNNRRLETYVVASNDVISQRNDTDDVWNRHEIQDSLPLDYVIKYPNAYYNELDNNTFTKGLIHVFEPNSLLLNGSEWTKQIEVNKEHIPPKLLQMQYKKIISWILNRLNTNAKVNFNIPGDDPMPFQIIHDYWKSWSKNILIPNRFLYNIEVVIYRESKYHAKHVRFIVITDKDNIIGVVETKILGIIFEDKFGLFPIVQSDMMDLTNEKTMPYDENILASYPPILDNETIEKEVKRREEQNALNKKTATIFEKSPPQ